MLKPKCWVDFSSYLSSVAAIFGVFVGIPNYFKDQKKKRSQDEIIWLKRGIQFINALLDITNPLSSTLEGNDVKEVRYSRIRRNQRHIEDFLNEFDLIYLYLKDEEIESFKMLRETWIKIDVNFESLIDMGWPDETRLEGGEITPMFREAFLSGEKRKNVEKIKDSIIEYMKSLRNPK